MSALVWGMEWRLALVNRRDLALRVVGPLSLVVVFTTGALSAEVAPAACAALFAAIGILSTAVPLRRDLRSGLSRRALRGGIAAPRYLLQRAAASGALALVSLLPALAVVAASLGASARGAAIGLAALAVSLWVASLLGVLLAAGSRSGTELLALTVVALALLLHMSGAFHTPPAEGYGALLEGAAPFRMLHESLVAMPTDDPVAGVVGAVAWAVALPAFVALLASRLTGYPPRTAS